MIRRMLQVGLLLSAIAVPWGSAAGGNDGLLEFTESELLRIQRHGPWPLPVSRDPSNRVSGSRAAIDLGEELFFDKQLSPKGALACGSCHVPELEWSDGRERAAGMVALDRNTPNLVNVRLNRWFGWDGAGDSLWGQSLRPLQDPRELGASAQHVAEFMRNDPAMNCGYRKAFGTPPSGDAEAVMVNVAKALAAYQETIVSSATRFDEFRDALARGDRAAAARYSLAAQRGLKIFIGKGNCSTCHSGPNFTNGEFHDNGVLIAVAGRVDPGRREGINSLLSSRYNLLGPYNDDPTRSTAAGTRQVSVEHLNPGRFKVPPLRNAALSGPYMHNGSLTTMRDVVRHYSETNADRPRAEGEPVVKALKLSAQESDDLITFIESLSDYRTQWRRDLPRDRFVCD